MVRGTGPGVLPRGEPGRLLAGTRRPVSCLGSGRIQYLNIFPQHIYIKLLHLEMGVDRRLHIGVDRLSLSSHGPIKFDTSSNSP